MSDPSIPVSISLPRSFVEIIGRVAPARSEYFKGLVEADLRERGELPAADEGPSLHEALQAVLAANVPPEQIIATLSQLARANSAQPATA